MNAVLQPLFWRLANEHNSDLDVVSVLMPRGEEADKVAIEYAIDVSFKPSTHHQNPIDLRWSEDDSELFMSLLRKVMNITDKDIQLDIEDNMIQGLIHLVATARFHTPWPGDELEGEDFMTYRKEIEVGDLISLNTIHGFFSGVIVALDSIDATKDANGSEIVNVIFASSKIFNWDPLSWETSAIDGSPKYKS